MYHSNSAIYKALWDRGSRYMRSEFENDSLEKFFVEPDLDKYNSTDGVVGLAMTQICLFEVLNDMLRSNAEHAEFGGFIGHSSGGHKYLILPFPGEISYLCFTGCQKYL